MRWVWLLAVVGALGCDASSKTSAPAASSNAPALVEFTAGGRALRGYLYRPEGQGPFPAVVFNHGSEPTPGKKEGQAAFYVPRGFVLFVPHRRGHGESKDAGVHIDSLVGEPQAFVDELVAQTDDVLAAIDYVAAQAFVDKQRIAAVGCSLGGIMSLFAAEKSSTIVAAVDFAGAAITWSKMPPLQERMKEAARAARVPVFFLQAENDYDTSPSLVLSDEMRKHDKPMRVRIFPPKGSSKQDGHSFCVGGAQPPWGDDVVAFLNEAATRSPERASSR